MKITLKAGDKVTFKPWAEWKQDYGIGEQGFYRDYEHHPAVYTVREVDDDLLDEQDDEDELSFSTTHAGYVFLTQYIQTINGRKPGFQPHVMPEDLFTL